MGAFRQDLRRGALALPWSPAFAAVAVPSPTPGSGAGTTTFTLVSAIFHVRRSMRSNVEPRTL